MSATLSFFRRGTCRPEFWDGSKSMFSAVKKQGFTFVRIFVRDDWFSPLALARTLYNAEKAGLRVLVTHEWMDFQCKTLLVNPEAMVDQTKIIAKTVADFSSDARVIFALANELPPFARPAAKDALGRFWKAHTAAARSVAPKHTVLLPAYAYNRPFYGNNDHADLPELPASNVLLSGHAYWPPKFVRSAEVNPWPWEPKPVLVHDPAAGYWEPNDNAIQPGAVKTSFDRVGIKTYLERVVASPVKIVVDEWGPVFERESPGAAQYRADFESVCDELGVMRCLWEGARQ